MKTTSLFLVAALFAAPAAADISVEFREGAPKDRFTFTNTGNCDLSSSVITLDLSGSQAGLIFDVTGSGAGVEVFQPFEVVAGRADLESIPAIKDGDTSAKIRLSQLKSKDSFSFTIDLDDTVSARGITVSGGEIEGASVTLLNPNGSTTASFGRDAKADLKLVDCT